MRATPWAGTWTPNRWAAIATRSTSTAPTIRPAPSRRSTTARSHRVRTCSRSRSGPGNATQAGTNRSSDDPPFRIDALRPVPGQVAPGDPARRYNPWWVTMERLDAIVEKARQRARFRVAALRLEHPGQDEVALGRTLAGEMALRAGFAGAATGTLSLVALPLGLPRAARFWPLLGAPVGFFLERAALRTLGEATLATLDDAARARRRRADESGRSSRRNSR